jgi:hypothetical protein
MKITKSFLFYCEDNIEVHKTIEFEQHDGRQDLVTNKTAMVMLFDQNLISVEDTSNPQGNAKSIRYGLQGANILLTVLESFRRGMIPARAKGVWISDSIQIKASTTVQGTTNLCLTRVAKSEKLEEKREIFLTPVQAASLEKCIYHVLSYLARV